MEHNDKQLCIRYQRDRTTAYVYFDTFPTSADVIDALSVDADTMGMDSLAWLTDLLPRLTVRYGKPDALPCLWEQSVGDWRLNAICNI